MTQDIFIQKESEADWNEKIKLIQLENIFLPKTKQDVEQNKIKYLKMKKKTETKNIIYYVKILLKK